MANDKTMSVPIAPMTLCCISYGTVYDKMPAK